MYGIDNKTTGGNNPPPPPPSWRVPPETKGCGGHRTPSHRPRSVRDCVTGSRSGTRRGVAVLSALTAVSQPVLRTRSHRRRPAMSGRHRRNPRHERDTLLRRRLRRSSRRLPSHSPGEEHFCSTSSSGSTASTGHPRTPISTQNGCSARSKRLSTRAGGVST